jgi:hypothetical protein
MMVRTPNSFCVYAKYPVYYEESTKEKKISRKFSDVFLEKFTGDISTYFRNELYQVISSDILFNWRRILRKIYLEKILRILFKPRSFF